MHIEDRKSGRNDRANIYISFSILILSSIILAAHANYYLPFISDDSLISLRYAERLLDGHGLSWTDGNPVEGYSNLLWILLIAAGGWFGIDLLTGVRILGLACMCMALGAFIYYRHIARLAHPAPTLIGSLIFALAAPVAVWAIGGLEQPLVACLLAWALVLSLQMVEKKERAAKYAWGASICLALLSIARLDGILFTVTALMGIVFVKGMNRYSLRLGLRLIVLPFIFYLGQLIFRLAYYGEWLPNPALVRISASWHRIDTGWTYLKTGVQTLSPISEIALLFILFSIFRWPRLGRRQLNRIVFLVIPACLWSCYLVLIGGDIFPAWRHFVPLVVIMALIVAEGASWFVHYTKSHVFKLPFYAFWALCLVWFVWFQFTDPDNQRAIHERWEWDGQVVGLMLKKGLHDARPLLAVTAAGCLAYWSGLPSLDMLGLNDYHIPRHPPEGFGRGVVGHELGDGKYVLSRKPDLVIFSGPHGSMKGFFISGVQMQAEHEFYEQYTPVRFEGRVPYKYQSLIWVRRYSRKIGIQQTDTSITVPAYLINGRRETIARLNEAGAFVISLSQDFPAAVDSLRLFPGSWSVNVDPPAGVRMVVHTGDKDEILFNAPPPDTFRLPDTSYVHIILIPEDTAEVEIEGLVFSRTQE